MYRCFFCADKFSLNSSKYVKPCLLYHEKEEKYTEVHPDFCPLFPDVASIFKLLFT
jgi:hypothetical protein